MDDQYQFCFQMVKIEPFGGPAFIITTADIDATFQDRTIFSGEAFTLLPNQPAKGISLTLNSAGSRSSGPTLDTDLVLKCALLRALADLENELQPGQRLSEPEVIDQNILYLGQLAGFNYDFKGVGEKCGYYVLRDEVRKISRFPVMTIAEI